MIDELLDNNAKYVATFRQGSLSSRPTKKVAVVACMDARLDPARVLGLEIGDAHVIRNAGGLITDDAIRSLVISQRLLGSEEIMLIHHTDCGMEALDEAALAEEIAREAGTTPSFSLGSFSSAEEDLKESVARIVESPFIPIKRVRAYLYEVESGRLREVPVP